MHVIIFAAAFFAGVWVLCRRAISKSVVPASLLLVGSTLGRADTLVSTTTFTYTGSEQTYTVPAGANYIVIKAWGGGGGGASIWYNSFTNAYIAGSDGSLITAGYTVLEGIQFQVTVGGGGTGRTLSGTDYLWVSGGYPGGASARAESYSGHPAGGGGGGGYSKVITPYGTIWAGGGGGAGSGTNPGWPETNPGSPGTEGQGGQPYGAGCGGGGGGFLGGRGGAATADIRFHGNGQNGSSSATGFAESVSISTPGGSYGTGGTSSTVNGDNGRVEIEAYSRTVTPSYPSAPSINSGTTRIGHSGAALNYWITAANTPTSFSASGLPSGLSLNTSNGLISGTPTTAGTYSSTITATNPTGSDSITLTWIIDDTAPTAPTAVTYASRTATTIELAWSGATDNVDIFAYEVRRNGNSLGVTSATSLPMGGLEPSTSYVFAVRTLDYAGNWSSWSSDATIATTADTGAPSAPTGILVVNRSASFLTLSWGASVDDVGVVDYEISYGAGPTVVHSASAWVSVSSLTPNTTYTFKVRAKDAAGNTSAWSDDFTIKTYIGGADTLLSTTSFGYVGKTTQSYLVPADTDYVVVKTWGAGGGGGFNGSSSVAGGNGAYTAATYPAQPGDTFTVSVGQGGYGEAWFFTAGGKNVQTSAGQGGWPGGFTGVSGGGGYTSVVMPYGTVWAKGGAGGYSGGGLGGYISTLGSTYATGSPYNVIASPPGLGSNANIDAYYPGHGTSAGAFVGVNGIAQGVNGGNGGVVILAYKLPDTSPVSFSRTYVATGSTQTYTAPAGVDHVLVKVWGGGGSGIPGVSSGGGGGFSSNSYSLTAGQTISISVGKAGTSGGSGNSSSATMPGSITLTGTGGASAGGGSPSTGGTSDPFYPGNNVGNGGLSTDNPAAGGDGAIVIVTYYATPVITSPTAILTPPGIPVNYTITATNAPTSFAATGLPAGLSLNTSTGAITGSATASGTSTIYASNAGATGSATLTWTFGADTTPPSTPAGLASSNLYSNTFVLTWSASTDDSGVVEYEVRRSGTSLGAASTSRTMAILGLSASTTYSMEVRAKDAAGNWSNWSSPLSVTTTSTATPTSSVATSTFTDGSYSYTVPTGTNYLLVKAWGGGGGKHYGGGSGGAGGFIAAAFNVTGGQTVALEVPGGSNWAGGATIVDLPTGTTVIAGGGGSAGTLGAGGAGGGGNGAGPAAGQGGGAGVGGAGGQGDGYEDNPEDPDHPIWIGRGEDGGLPGGGAGGNGGYQGGFGGAGFGGGGGGGGGPTVGGGGGGGGGSGVSVGTLTPVAVQTLAGPNTSDPNFPTGSYVAYGGVVSGGETFGGSGYVALLAYSGPPAVTSVLAKTVVQYAPVSYQITVAGTVTAYSVSGLPSGLTLNPVSGEITGRVATAGTYSTIIGAATTGGTTLATLVWTVTTDSTAPSAPSGLASSNATTTGFRLSWSASTDNVAVASYNIYQDGGPTAIGNTSGLYYDVTGLMSGTTYTYTVKAVDNPGNLSSASSPLSVSISTDTQAPTQVAGVALASQSAAANTITWSPAGDNYGVNHYEVWDGATKLGETAETGYVHTGIGSGSHSYKVYAVDAAGNRATVSATLSVSAPGGGAVADADGDGIPDSIETSALLGTNPASAATSATNATLPLNLHRPN